MKPCILLIGTVLTSAVAAAGPEDFASDEFQINTWFANDQRAPALAGHTDGDLITVWQSTNQAGQGLSVFGQRLDKSGDLLGGEFLVNAQTVGRQDAASVVFVGDGGFAVAWTGPAVPGGSPAVWLRRFDRQGRSLIDDTLIHADAALSQRLPRVVSDGGQHLLVVWESQRNTGGDTVSVLGRWLELDGTPVSDTFVVNAFATGAQRWPDVAMAPGGQAVVTWASSHQDGDGWGVFARCLPGADAPPGDEFQVNQSTRGGQNQPRVAMLNDGRFAITWWDDMGMSLTQDFYRRIQTRLFTSDCQPAGDEVQVNQFDHGVQDVPAIAAGAGDYFVAWQSYPAEGFARQGAYARRINGNGGFIGDEFRLSQEVQAYQDHPAIAVTPEGGLMAVWETLGQDGSGFGIFGRLFFGTRVVVTADAGDGQSATAGEAFEQPLTVQAIDQWSRPMAGIALRFSTPADGATAHFPNGLTTLYVTTDEHGRAATTLTAAAGHRGTFEVRVSAEGNGADAIFHLTVQTPPPVAVPLFGWPGQSLLMTLILGFAAWTIRQRFSLYLSGHCHLRMDPGRNRQRHRASLSGKLYQSNSAPSSNEPPGRSGRPTG